MKIRQEQKNLELNDNLKNHLERYRKERNFNIEEYLTYKSKLIIDYINSNKIKNVIISLSGGIDSTVALAILIYAKNKENDNSFNIKTISSCVDEKKLPNQKLAKKTAKNIAKKYNIEHINFSLDKVTDLIDKKLTNKLNIEQSSSWAKGQLIPYLRTPLNYYYATLLTETNGLTVICGTTNRDEGAYLGYVGKASDYIVDLQIISDLHKSEVYKIANFLNIDKYIIDREPDGDLHDNKKDVDIFGASYDFVELYMNYLNKPKNYQKILEQDELFIHYKNNIEKLHNYNKHKYLIGSPAVHFDIMNSGVNNGWKIDFNYKYYKELYNVGNIIKKEFNSPIILNNDYFNSFVIKELKPIKINKNITLIKNFLSDEENDVLKQIYNTTNIRTLANENGYKCKPNEKTLSYRKSLYSIELSEFIYNNLSRFFPKTIYADNPITDWNKKEMYNFVGINPLFRFIKYEDGGILNPHYDYSYKNDNYKSLWTLIIYLTDNETGQTVFFRDSQENKWDKNLEDIKYNDNLIITNAIIPSKCSILLFPHYMLHGSLPLINEKEKLIIRTDLMFEKKSF